MSSCSLFIVHASLKNMVSRKTRLKFLVPKTACHITWQKNSWLPQFFEFRPEILHAYFWMHMKSNNDEKNRFFDPFTGEAPLKLIDALQSALEKLLKYYWKFNWFYSAVLILNPEHKFETFKTTQWEKEMAKRAKEKFEKIYKNFSLSHADRKWSCPVIC